ncbi:MAG: E3 binding domain-containing protein [Gemmatimonadaceae bacterium]|nr:E3 binding domain-containing protein [Gemmatimonadaceae bacterium]
MAVEIVMPRLGWTMEEGTLVEWMKKPGEAVQAGEILFTVETDKAINEVESFDAGRLHIPADAPGPGATVAVGTVIGYLLAEGEEPPASAAPAAPQGSGAAAAPPAASEVAGRGAARASAAGSSTGAAPAAPSEGAGQRDGSAPAGPAPEVTPAGRAAQEAARARPASEAAAPRQTPAGSAATPGGGTAGAREDSATAGAASAPAISPRARRLAQQLGIDWRKVRGTGRTGRITEDDVRAAAADQACGGGSTEQ